MLSCWAYEASDRPTFVKIAAQVSEILAMASDYLSFDMPFTPSAVGGLQEQAEKGEGLLAICHTLYEQEEVEREKGSFLPSPPSHQQPPPKHTLYEQEEEVEKGEGLNHTHHRFQEDGEEEVEMGVGPFVNHTLIRQDLELRTEFDQNDAGKPQDLEGRKLELDANDMI